MTRIIPALLLSLTVVNVGVLLAGLAVGNLEAVALGAAGAAVGAMAYFAWRMVQ